MTIEHYLYGMFGGKISMLKTDGINALVSDKNLNFLRTLPADDPNDYWWLPTEQVVLLPRVRQVSDENGREWVQNHTLVIPIHDYIQATKHLFDPHFYPLLDALPDQFPPLAVNSP